MGFMRSSRFVKESKREQAMREIEKRRGKSATYTVPLVGSTEEQTTDVDSFLAEFYSHAIYEKSKEMKRLLSEHPETLGTHYGLLVPNVVSFDQFWSRYFYRCSLTTVLAEQQAEQENGTNQPLSSKEQKELRRQIQEGLSVSKDKAKDVRRRRKIGLPHPTGLGELCDDDIVETIVEEEDEIAFAASG